MILATVTVIIPALNEAETIADVIQKLQQLGLTNVCVVDNGSKDCTTKIATAAGAQVAFEPRKGYGQACWCGLQSLVAKQADWILFCDADGSDDLSQLPELLALRDRYDLILGNRRGTLAGKAQLAPVQNFGNWLATRLIRLGWGHTYEDLGPLRLIRKTALDRLSIEDRGFGWTVEMQAKAVERGLRICEYPVNYRPRQGGQSKISGTVVGSFKAGRVILTTLSKLYIKHLIRQKRPARISTQKLLLWLSALCLVLGSVLAMPYGNFLNQPNAVPLFWRGMGLMSVGFVMSWRLRRISRWWFWGVAIAPRLVLLAMYPGDDIWRYLWEGYIQNAGFNPYLVAPDADVLMPFRFDWWNDINHPHLPAIYPPITQLGFRLLALISPSVLLFKSAFVAADLAICALLSRRFGYLATLLYAWNPLVIYSFAGGGHYDSWFLLPLVFAWLSWDRRLVQLSEPTLSKTAQRSKSYLQAAICSLSIGLSVAVKWMSLPLLGFLAWRSHKIQDHKIQDHNAQENKTSWTKSFVKGAAILCIGTIPFAIATLPFCQILDNASGPSLTGLPLSCPVIPISSPFVSYGRSAALLPSLLDSLLNLASWPKVFQTNAVYAFPLAIWILWNLARTRSFEQFSERYLIALMLLSPIIHAWYFTWLVPFAVASRNWGTQLVSLSAFIYFALPYGIATGSNQWMLSELQRWLLWTPFILGLVISATSNRQQPL